MRAKILMGLLGLLLITTLCVGILLVQTVGQRNVLDTSLQNAKGQIKQKDQTIREKTDDVNNAKIEAAGCQAQLQKKNEETAFASLSSAQNMQEAAARAGFVLSSLPDQLTADRSTSPSLANQWVKGLFQ